MKKYKILDLFSGCGGFSSGFEQAGFKVVAALDKFPSALKTLKYNHQDVKTFCCDITKTEPFQLFKKKSIDVVIGGPPCQGFSNANLFNRPNYSVTEDPRNVLYKHFLKYIKFLEPQAFVMENVKPFYFKNNGKFLTSVLKDFDMLGYQVSAKVLNAQFYGIPQNRERVFIVGIKGKLFNFDLIPKQDPISVYEAIGDLPKYKAQSYDKEPFSNYQKKIRNGSSFLYDHTYPKHSDKTLQILSLIPPDGNQTDLPSYLKKKIKFDSHWMRLKKSCPSRTVLCSQEWYHYKLCRTLTLREYARIQSFVDTYRFFGSYTDKKIQIGNSVPPFLAKEIASLLLKTLNK